MADIVDVLLLAVLVGVTGWYAWLTKRIAQASERSAHAAAETAEASERSARTGVEAAQAAARSAATAEAALLAESMPFVRPSFGGGSSGSAGDRFTMTVRNSGRHAALNVALLIGGDLLHTFSVVEPGDSESYEWGDETAKRLWDARTGGSTLTTRYSDPYGNRYQVEVQQHVAGEAALQERVFTYRLTPDGTPTPLLSPGGG